MSEKWTFEMDNIKYKKQTAEKQKSQQTAANRARHTKSETHKYV